MHLKYSSIQVEWHLTSMDLLMIRWSDNGVARSAAEQAAFCWSWHCESKSKRNWHIWRQTNKQTHTLMPTTYTFIIYHIIEEWTNTAAVAVLRSLCFSMTKLTPSSATSSPLNTHSRLSCGMFNISIQSSRAMVHNVYCTCQSLSPSRFLKQRRAVQCCNLFTCAMYACFKISNFACLSKIV